MTDAAQFDVQAWEEAVSIPTYLLGEPDKNPMFFEKRVYQGSSGVVYPHPIIEKIYDDKVDHTYHAVFLENRYLKIMILPELGGRVQMAYDKIKQRHFVYYNHVIKPALVGLTGPWISGGIEFNWPQHHRPSTFEPVDYTLERLPDGSQTVWVSEVEQMFHTKGMAGFTLYPDKAYLEIKAKLYNRTAQPQHFLWWANPALAVNDDYQSVFPPDVHAVFDHGKRDVSRFPIATGTYYKVDYSRGVDISRYKNIPVPTSYMAIQSNYDFVGGYEHDTQAGLLHVADHHVSPGKKQWTWGCGDFGQAWDRHLTDADGPYVELMTGVFTDNQPDFSWLNPYEEKTFTQYFLPYHDVGLVKNANQHALVNLEVTARVARIWLYVTAAQRDLTVTLQGRQQTYLTKICDLRPEDVFHAQVPLLADERDTDLRLTVLTANGAELIAYQPETPGAKPLPEPARPALPPEQVRSTEQLYLTGLHLEQYRHATYHPTDYYLEALKRDATDARNNNAYGLWLLRRGQFQRSEAYFRQAIATLTERNPNPYDGEPFYNLGVSLKYQGRLHEAFDAFFKSVWNGAWQDSGYFELARLATMRRHDALACDFVNKSLARNAHNHQARHLKAALLRRLGRYDEMARWLAESLQLDAFDFGSRYESYLLRHAQQQPTDAALELALLQKLMRGAPANYLEYADDYAAAGLFDEAIDLLTLALPAKETDKASPLLYYHLGYAELQRGNRTQAVAWYQKAASLKPDYCFPNRLADIPVLQAVADLNPTDAKAYYYLGNLWYDKRQSDEALTAWENALLLNPTFPTVHRNLALAYYNKRHDPEKAQQALEKAFALNPTDARVLMELDQLYKKLNRPPQERLKFLEQHLALVEYRDDLYLERVTLYNLLGEYEIARDLLAARHFHPWEGGEGKAAGQYVCCHLELAKHALRHQQHAHALELLAKTERYPQNLGEGKLFGAQENHLHYFAGCACQGLGNADAAQAYFMQAAVGLSEPAAAMFYNDQPPEMIFYQGLAQRKLGWEDEARRRFQKLNDYGTAHQSDAIKVDYFAVSLPDLLVFDEDFNKRNQLHCQYLQGLGYLGLQQREQARRAFEAVLAADVNHQGARIHLQMLEELGGY